MLAPETLPLTFFSFAANILNHFIQFRMGWLSFVRFDTPLNTLLVILEAVFVQV